MSFSEESEYEQLSREEEFEEPQEYATKYGEGVIRPEDLLAEFNQHLRTPQGRALYELYEVLTKTYSKTDSINNYITRITNLENYEYYNMMLLSSAMIYLEGGQPLNENNINSFITHYNLSGVVNILDLIRYIRLVNNKRI